MRPPWHRPERAAAGARAPEDRPAGSRRPHTRTRADRILTAAAALATVVIVVGATMLVTISLARSDERVQSTVRRSWSGAFERQTFRVVPVEASVESLGGDRVLELFDELMHT